MSKVKVLGNQYGIEITRPWNDKMYEHNDKVASEMKENIFQAINKAYNDDDETALKEIGKSVSGYGFGFGFGMDEMHAQISKELDRVQNFWLNDVYPHLVKKGYVKELEIGFVGYGK
jgi:basic membrane lipoprotein Med (substrate-binding protein (PBP1-ABC) superfamily)